MTTSVDILDPRSIYEETGPRHGWFAEAVEALVEATGWTARYVQVSSEFPAALLVGQDVPVDLVARLEQVAHKLVDRRAFVDAYEANEPAPARQVAG